MNTKQPFVFGASTLAAALGGGAVAQEADGQYVQVAEIEIDPAQLDAYRAAVQEPIDAAIREEPGVVVLYAVYERITRPMRPMSGTSKSTETGKPTKRTLASDHFKKYKATTQTMVKSIKLVQTTPIMLGAKSR
jgi:quinol monooxygenase YgiN